MQNNPYYEASDRNTNIHIECGQRMGVDAYLRTYYSRLTKTKTGRQNACTETQQRTNFLIY